MYYEIGVINQNIDFYCTYCSCEKLQTGQLVSVNFNRREAIGIVFNEQQYSSYTGQIKNITAILPYVICNAYLDFVKFISSYNLIPIGSALKLLCPFNLILLSKTVNKLDDKVSAYENKHTKLNLEQQSAMNAITLNEFQVYLLHGVTGSGKTEVFLEVAKNLVNAQILILVPEIALSSAIATSIEQRCGKKAFIWHNSISSKTKLNIWQNAIGGSPIIVVGARSALFIPFVNLKLIVIDEEHDTSFKQNDHQIYNARDMAIYLASILNIPIILSSATPSVESYKNAQDGKYKYLKLTSRYYEQATIPNIKIHDMRYTSKNTIFSKETIERMQYYLNNNQQVLIFVNRRGYASKRLCTKCGWKAMCPACDTWLCYHSINSELICHHCGYTCTNIQQCRKCGNKYLINYGIGVEKVFAECNKLFSKYKIIMCSSDNMNTPTKIDNVIQNITNHNADIIIGTQILAKGHNFKSLNLVVIANLDYMLYTENFRALENTYQLLSQVAGRAGRTGEFPAEVIIQTYNPNELMLSMIANQTEFYANELNNRQLTNMPPYSHVTSLEIISLDKSIALDYAQKLTKKFQSISSITATGPIIPNLHKINYKYRYKIILISKHSLQSNIQNIIREFKTPYRVRVKIDIDPYNFD